jgi:hypothetical protein
VRVKPAGGAEPATAPARSFEAAIARVRKEREQRRGEPAEPKRRPEPPLGRPREPEPQRAGAEPRSSTSAAHPVVAAGALASTNAGSRSSEPALPELREAARAVPPAIWAGRLDGAATLELAFGRDLSVELRRSAAGIELTVRAGVALARAARVDLPALVRSLRGRGVVVARAEVRGGCAGWASRAVDARPPLR